MPVQTKKFDFNDKKWRLKINFQPPFFILFSSYNLQKQSREDQRPEIK